MAPDFRVRLDPWEPDYEGAIQVTPDDELGDVDLSVELGSWIAVQPAAISPPSMIFFVDGVRRIEHRILAEAGDRTLFGLFGSLAVGATQIAGAASVVGQAIQRFCVLGGGLESTAWSFRLPASDAALTFAPLTVAENTPEAPLQGLQNSMRESEAALAASLSANDRLVFLDGPLTFFTATKLPVVGFVKRLLRSYLPPDKALLLRGMGIGQRTPIFLIKDTRRRRYSWYSRIAVGRVIDSPLTGIVRLEASSSLDLLRVQALADLSTVVLPRFASAQGHDPRAPQNLYPVGGLERILRHMLGDHLVIRRAIEAYIHSRERAA